MASAREQACATMRGSHTTGWSRSVLVISTCWHTHVHSSVTRSGPGLGQPMWPLTGGRVSKMCLLRTVECPSALKRKESLAQAPAWVSLEHIVLSEVGQPQKDGACVVPRMGRF